MNDPEHTVPAATGGGPGSARGSAEQSRAREAGGAEGGPAARQAAPGEPGAGAGAEPAEGAGDAEGAGGREAGRPAPPLPPGQPSGRVDRWIWAVRLAKTRADAARACRGGHVRVNDRAAKPATTVRVGDEVQVRLNGVTRIVDVTHIIDKRVGAPVAVRCYTDRSPEPPPQARGPVLRRDRGTGRPTKRDRRQIERLRGER